MDFIMLFLMVLSILVIIRYIILVIINSLNGGDELFGTFKINYNWLIIGTSLSYIITYIIKNTF